MLMLGVFLHPPLRLMQHGCKIPGQWVFGGHLVVPYLQVMLEFPPIVHVFNGNKLLTNLGNQVIFFMIHGILCNANDEMASGTTPEAISNLYIVVV